MFSPEERWHVMELLHHADNHGPGVGQARHEIDDVYGMVPFAQEFETVQLIQRRATKVTKNLVNRNFHAEN